MLRRPAHRGVLTAVAMLLVAALVNGIAVASQTAVHAASPAGNTAPQGGSAPSAGAVSISAAPPASTAPSIAPVTDCAALASVDLSSVSGAPSSILSATTTTDTVAGAKHTYCTVWGYIAPQTTFGIKLPVSGWQGQYVQEGCGGLCGQANLTTVPLAASGCMPTDNGQAVIATDNEGHLSGKGTDGLWGKNDYELRVVFGRTSEHSLVTVAKTIIARYYGRAPTHSYFDGCSDGGREALMLAQRYPDDFDGIIAGAPANNFAPLLIYEAWLARSNTDATGHQVLAADKLPALHAAVIRACGNADGVIVDPRTCAFDPATMACAPGTNSTTCLTPAELDTVRKLYRGPTDEHGNNLYDGGEPYGSELAWSNWLAEPASDTNAPADTEAALLASNYLKYLGYWPNPPDNFTLADFRFTDQQFAALNVLGRRLYNADDPDLRAFRAHGGKLILYQGWADQAISPWSTLDYYAAVERSAGGFRASQSFSRLYMIPGGYHCLGGLASGSSSSVDFLTPLISWVEHGIAPSAISLRLASPSGTGNSLPEIVSPANASASVGPATGSLNGQYHYVSRYR